MIPSAATMQQVADMFPFPIKLTKGSFKKLEIIFKDGEILILHDGVDLRDFSFIWLCSSWQLRDSAYAIEMYLKKNRIPCTHVEKGTSKLTDHMVFGLGNIPSPDSIFIDVANIREDFFRIEETCGFPLLIKDVKGSRGLDSEIVLNKKDLLKKLKALPKHKKYFFQRYIPNKYDWGIMVSNGKVVSGEKGYPCQGEFRNNACNGAKEVFIDSRDIPQNIKEIAIKVSKMLGLSWSRTDIVIDKKTKKPYVMETNRFPGITSKTSEVEGAYEFLSSQIAHRMEFKKQ